MGGEEREEKKAEGDTGRPLSLGVGGGLCMRIIDARRGCLALSRIPSGTQYCCYVKRILGLLSNKIRYSLSMSAVTDPLDQATDLTSHSNRERATRHTHPQKFLQ